MRDVIGIVSGHQRSRKMLMQLTDQTFRAGEGAAAHALSRVVGRDSKRVGLFGSENSAVTVRGLNGRAVDHKHEQESRNDPRNRGVLA